MKLKSLILLIFIALMLSACSGKCPHKSSGDCPYMKKSKSECEYSKKESKCDCKKKKSTKTDGEKSSCH